MTDSKFVFNARPLTYFVQTIFAAWDYQKVALVSQNCDTQKRTDNVKSSSVAVIDNNDDEENYYGHDEAKEVCILFSE
jgi:hypothetical protein